MPGKRSRDKGKVGERELANVLRRYGYDAHRGVQYHGGSDSPDVVGLPDVHIEVKRVERLQLYDALEQSRHDSDDNEFPVVMHRKNRKEWVVIQPLDDWIKLYEGAEELYRQPREKAEFSLPGFLKGLLEKLRGSRLV